MFKVLHRSFILAFLSLLPVAAEAVGCPPSGQVSQDGWSLDFETTAHDGLRASDVRRNGRVVIRSAKVVEWHTDYGANGFRPETGCTGGGGGFAIFPFGDTQVVQVPGGFHVVQDFRMSNWGTSCNYRLEQRLEFYRDGRFRLATGAYGRGCGTNTLYKPLMRIDIALRGDSGDRIDYWDGSDWQHMAVEDYRVPYAEAGQGPHQLTADNFAWRVRDAGSDSGYFIEPANGQYPGEGPGDDGILFELQHHPEEGDGDLGVIGDCCGDDHQEGPHTYLNGESIDGENLVLWYVPRTPTDSVGPDFSCWTVTGEPNPETYPCWSGPMFHPFGPIFTDGFESGNTSQWTSTVP